MTIPIQFFSGAASNKVTLGADDSTIGFATFHKLRNGEQVIYRTNGQTAVGGLTTDAKYFVRTTDNVTVTLHNTLADVISGINTVVLTSHGIGPHNLETVTKKSVIESVSVISSGDGYENKKRSCGVTGVSTSLNCIKIKNHDYKSGEIIKYAANFYCH